MSEFGVPIRQRDFYFDDSHTHINHGSYGAVPRPVQEERLRMIAELEKSPDVWFRWTSQRKWIENRQAAATFLGCDVENVVLVNNATTGCNAVVKSLTFEEGESILVYDYTYKAVENACHAAVSKSGGEVLTVGLPLKLDKATIIRMYREKLENYPNIKLVLLDLISSCSAIRYPIKELINLCKEHGKLVLVDGAHGPGQIPLELDTLGADFFTGNFHKWLYTPRGCAALWVHPNFHHIIKPSMTSHGYKSGTLQGDFYSQGTTDNTAFFSVQRATEYYQSLGGMAKITEHCCNLLDTAVNMLTTAWGTEKFPIDRELEAPFLRLVELPKFKGYTRDDDNSIFCDITPLMELLSYNYNITTVCLNIQGKNWIRISANVYNTLADYERLRDAILDIVKRDV